MQDPKMSSGRLESDIISISVLLLNYKTEACEYEFYHLIESRAILRSKVNQYVYAAIVRI